MTILGELMGKKLFFLTLIVSLFAQATENKDVEIAVRYVGNYETTVSINKMRKEYNMQKSVYFFNADIKQNCSPKKQYREPIRVLPQDNGNWLNQIKNKRLNRKKNIKQNINTAPFRLSSGNDDFSGRSGRSRVRIMVSRNKNIVSYEPIPEHDGSDFLEVLNFQIKNPKRTVDHALEGDESDKNRGRAKRVKQHIEF